MASNRGVAFSIVLLFAGLYLLTMRGTQTSVDDVPRYNLTIALLSPERSIQIPHSIMASPTTVDGRIYSKYGIGMSLVMVPFHLAGQGIAEIAPDALQGLMGQPHVFLMSTTNQWLGALACVLLFLIARRVGFRERTAFLVTLSTGLGSMLWLNAQTSFETVLVTVLIEIAVLALIGEGAVRWTAAAVAGAAMGYVFLTRWGDGWILLPGLVGLLVARLRHRGGATWRLVPVAVAFAVPLLVGIGLAMRYNYARFLDPFELGYDDDNVSWRFLHRGLYGFLFSPAKSVFVFTPLLILAVARFRRLWVRLGGGLRAGGLFWLIGAPLVVYSFFETWDGGWCFGPRYLLPSVVLAMLALGDWIENKRWAEALWRPALFTILLAVGLYAQWICLASNFNEYAYTYHIFRYYPEACPLLACPGAFFRPCENLWFWNLVVSPGVGLNALAVLLVPLVFLGLGIAGVGRELMSMWTGARERVRPKAPKFVRAVLALAALVAFVAVIRVATVAWRSARVREGSGLKASHFTNPHWMLPARLVRTDARLDFDWSGTRRPYEGDFSVRWEGEIEAPTSGIYFFGLDACGTATLWLDNRPVVFNPGPQPGRRLIICSTRLDAGWHPIRVEFASSPVVDTYSLNRAQYARARHLPVGLRLRWKPPGTLFLRTIPPRVLRPK